MMRTLRFFLNITFFCLLSCSKLAKVNKSYVNHPSMDLNRRSTHQVTSQVTVLGDGRIGSQAGCLTCAK